MKKGRRVIDLNRLMALQLFLFWSWAKLTNNPVLDLWIVCMKMWMWMEVTFHPTLRCQSCMYPGLKHCRGKRALPINLLHPKCSFGREPVQEMRWQDTDFFFFYLRCSWRWLPRLSLSGCVTLTSAVTGLVQLQLRRTLRFSSDPLESNKVQRTRRQVRLQKRLSLQK